MKQIADYALLERIGQGNHGVFYKAKTPARLGLDHEFCAVKVLEQQAGDDEFRRMANELKLFASARSEQLIRLYDAGHQRGTLYYAVAWHPLGSLAKPAEPRSLGQRVRAVAQAALGAHALHEVGVAHRDIKPANVMLTDGGGVLGDLGLAQTLNPGATITGTGPIGSIAYMEPGVVRGEQAGRASDIWSLGVTLHEAITGQGVFGEVPDHNVLGALRHVLESEPVIDASMPAELHQVVAWCLQRERGARPATAKELADALLELEVA